MRFEATLLLSLCIGLASGRLAGAGPEDSVSGLIDQFLGEKSYTARSKLQKALVARGAEVLPILTKRYDRTEDVAKRRLLVPLLAKFDQRGVVSTLAEIGSDDTDASCRRAAIGALGDFGEEGLTRLERMLGTGLSDLDKTQVVRAIGATGHERAPTLLVKALRAHTRSAQGAEFARVLGYHYPEVALEVFPGLTGKVEPPLLGQMIFLLHLYAEMLPESDAKEVKTRIARSSKKLLSEFATNVALDRVEIAKGLGALRAKSAEARLIELSKPTDSYVDTYLWALMRLDTDPAPGVFEKILGGEDPPKYGGGWSTRGLASSGAVDVIPRLIELVGSENEEIAAAAVDELRLRGVAEAAPKMGEVLLREGKSRAAKTKLLEALRELKNPAVAYPVARLAGGDDRYLRGPALTTLAELPGSTATDELLTLMDSAKLSSAEKKILYAGLATRDEEEVVGFFLEAMEDSALRPSVHQAMHTEGSVVHVPALLDRFADAEQTVKGHIVDLVGAAGDPVALPQVIAALKPAPLRSIAYKAIREIGDLAAVENLIPYLSSTDPNTFHGAFQTLVALDPDRSLSVVPELEPAIDRLLGELDGRGNARALELLGQSSSPRARGKIVAIVTTTTEGENAIRAARALAAIGVDTAHAEQVLAFLPDAPIVVQLPLLDGLLHAEDRALDQSVRKLGRKASAPLQVAIEAYALRSGLESSTKKLSQKISDLESFVWSSDAKRRSEADLVLEWVTGQAWPEEKRGRDRAPASAYYQLRGGELKAPKAPLLWQVLRAIEEKEPTWAEGADYASAIRSGKVKKLKAYLTKHQDGRHAEEARRRIQELGDG